ncbi:MAG: hypothetical protein WED00_05865 [Aquisalimonadaceae bacterium]
MTKEQLEVIVGLVAGVETAIVTLAKGLEAQGVIRDSQSLVTLFEDQAAALPNDVRNKELIALVLKHVATGLRGEGHDPGPEIARQLH